MKCAKDSFVVITVVIAVLGLVFGVVTPQISKATAQADEVRKEYRADLQDLRSEVNTKLGSMDAKLDKLIEYQLNHNS